MTLKRVKVVMLPTNKKANSEILLGVVPNLATRTKEVLNDTEWMKFGKPYHLYFVSQDEEIVEDDWFIKMNNFNRQPSLYKESKKAFMNSEWLNSSDVNDCFKVIATTDSSLSQTSFREIPRPSQDFIKVFVEEYNKGNQIEWINVEYEYNHDDTVSYPKLKEPKHILKVNSRNEITIRKMKNSWTREEVEQLLFKYAEEEHTWFSSKSETDSFNKWINENL